MNRLAYSALYLLLLVFAGCYALVYKRQDMKNLLHQLHLPADVEFLSFDSNPKEAGFFGREGLQIEAVMRLPPASFDEYLSILLSSRWTLRIR